MRVALDTNIILLDANNIFQIAKEYNNPIIVIPETVIDELDGKKSLQSELGYQAREFGRLLASATSSSIHVLDNYTVAIRKFNDIELHIVALKEYEVPTSSVSVNDSRIIQACSTYGVDLFITNDIMCGFRAEAAGLSTTDMKHVEILDVPFNKQLELPYEQFTEVHKMDVLEVDPNYQPNNFCYIFTTSESAQHKLAVVQQGKFNVIGKETEKSLREQPLMPINTGQLLMSYLIQDQSVDITVIESLAGSGKTAVALSNAMKLVSINSPYDSIIYIRNSIDDQESGEDVGYLAGNDEKLAVYLHPFHDSLATIVRNELKNKYKGKELEIAIAERVESHIAKYNMQPMIALGLRGRTFDNAVVIVDEAQNMSRATMQKILSRIGKNSKAIVVGSLRQIDNKYITKYTSGLSVLLDATKRTDLPIKLNATTLDKVVRGPITEFAELVFTKKGNT
jgi:PhoH-like ATPase